MSAVLFVAHDKHNLVACEAASAHEFDVLTARDAETALRLMREREVGVIITDQCRPRLSGARLLAQVREEFPDVVRILITPYADLPAAIDAINHGQVRRYLRKPWDPDELRAEVRDALDVYQTKRRLDTIEQRLAESERIYALGIVAAGIAHELRNPAGWLTSNLSEARQVIAEVGAALRQRADLHELRDQLCDASESLDDAVTAVDRIMDIVRSIELPSRAPHHEQVVDLGTVLQLTLRLVNGELRGVASLELDLRSSPKVRGSSTKLSQVMLNLLINAIHAVSTRGKPRGKIAVSLYATTGFASIEIADNGHGIEREHLPRIFDPFFTTKPGIGTGLGLPISKTIVETLGGRIEVESEPGRGARFRVVLPVASG
jgi:signal transduction histidine kinase